MIFDSHIHFWKYDKQRYSWMSKDMKLLREDHLPEHFALTQKRNEVEGVIAVEADGSELENHFLIELAKTHPIIRGIVGCINVKDKNAGERLSYFSQYSIIKGWRYDLQKENEGILKEASFHAALDAMQSMDHTFDLLITAEQLPFAGKIAEQFPGVIFILDHCGKPDLRTGNKSQWESDIRELAKHTNVHCKVSGLLTQTKWKDWKPGDFYPHLDVVFDAFGTHRLMFGSDWPVMLLSGIYVQWKSLLEKYMENYSSDEVQQVFSTNCKIIYEV